MTPRERAEQTYFQLFNGEPPDSGALEILTHAIEEAVEEALEQDAANITEDEKASLIEYRKMLQGVKVEICGEAIATEREANAKFADKCTKLMHCNVAAAIRSRK